MTYEEKVRWLRRYRDALKLEVELRQELEAQRARACKTTAALTGMADAGADIAKLAVMPRNRADAARLLLATAQAAAQRPGKALITMSMGRDGAVTRFCGGAFGSAATFGTLSAASAPGQPPVTLLKEKLILGEDL